MTRRLLVALLLVASAAAQDPAALSDEAMGLAQEGRLTEAEALWKQALQADPDYYPALFNLGFMNFSNKRFAAAEPYLEKAVKAAPDDFNAHYVAGANYQQLGRPEDALRQWQRAIEINPANQQLMLIMVVEYNKGRYFHAAAELAERALELSTADPNVYFVAIKAHQDDQNHAAALRVAGELVKRYPDLPRSHAEYAFELREAGRLEEALPYLEKAMAGDPDREEPFFYYGEILQKQGENEKAIPALKEAVRLRPDYMTAWTTLGRALMALKKYEEAAAEMEKAVKVDPEHPQPHLLLSQIYFRLGEEERAATEKKLSLRLRRENPEAMEMPAGRPFPAGAPSQ